MVYEICQSRHVLFCTVSNFFEVTYSAIEIYLFLYFYNLTRDYIYAGWGAHVWMLPEQLMRNITHVLGWEMLRLYISVAKRHWNYTYPWLGCFKHTEIVRIYIWETLRLRLSVGNQYWDYTHLLLKNVEIIQICGS